MQIQATPENADDASVIGTLSRRSFLAVAGSAATLPVAAYAGSSGQLGHLIQPSLESQLDACIAQLRGILEKMHPQVVKVHDYFKTGQDGTFRLSIQGERLFGTYEGEGFYEVSDGDGYLVTYWLREDWQRRVSDGTPIPGGKFYWATMYYNGEVVDAPRRLFSPGIVRKLEGGEI